MRISCCPGYSTVDASIGSQVALNNRKNEETFSAFHPIETRSSVLAEEEEATRT